MIVSKGNYYYLSLYLMHVWQYVWGLCSLPVFVSLCSPCLWYSITSLVVDRFIYYIHHIAGVHRCRDYSALSDLVSTRIRWWTQVAPFYSNVYLYVCLVVVVKVSLACLLDSLCCITTISSWSLLPQSLLFGLYFLNVVHSDYSVSILSSYLSLSQMAV